MLRVSATSVRRAQQWTHEKLNIIDRHKLSCIAHMWMKKVRFFILFLCVVCGFMRVQKVSAKDWKKERKFDTTETSCKATCKKISKIHSKLMEINFKNLLSKLWNHPPHNERKGVSVGKQLVSSAVWRCWPEYQFLNA